MAQINLRGIFPPITTPFIDENVAYDKLAANVEKWGKTGINGFVVLGSNGESVYLSEEEKRRVVETVARSAPLGKSVIAGTGCESTRETLRLTKDCAERGALAALVITPHFFGGRMDEGALDRHYRTLADHAPIPIILYNVPKFTHLNLSANIVSKLADHPNIIGIKDSAGIVNQLGEYLNHVPEDFSVLVGTAGALFGGITLGCAGGVLALANVAPEPCVRIFDLVSEGRFEEAGSLQLRMIPVNKAVTATYGIGGLKAAMDMLDYFGGKPRMPLFPSTAAEKAEIRKILSSAGLLS
ncbi:dihydrodipicolinate synthase family protein [Thermodesulfobacteriota bacterium]